MTELTPAATPDGLTYDQMLRINEHVRGKKEYAQQILELFGVSRFGEVPQDRFPLLLMIVERVYRADWLSEAILYGKSVRDLTSDELANATKALRQSYERSMPPATGGEDEIPF